MTGFEQLVVGPLDASHDRAGFHCGVETLDLYLSRQAGQDIRRRISRVFVATTPAAPATVVGYYTLSALSIELRHLPAATARKLPRHPLPAALIGRLAVRLSAQGHGVGRMLLADAVKRTLSVADQIAVYALVVDALDPAAAGFYEQFGFTRFDAAPDRLFLPLKSIGPV